MGKDIEFYENMKFSGKLESDTEMFKNIFKNDSILRYRSLTVNKTVGCSVFNFDGMVNTAVVNDSLVKPLVRIDDKATEMSTDYIVENYLYACDVKVTDSVAECIRGVVYGDTVLLFSGNTRAIIANTKGFRSRGIKEPDDERVLQGPREGFDEVAMLDLAMLRRKLPTPDLCIETLRLGRRTDTMIFICYLGSLAKKETVLELKKRINEIDIDGVLDVNYLAENIRDHKHSLFKTTGSTERPDTVAARLLEGRIAVFCDGTPVVLTVPYLFSENFQSDEDNYLNNSVSSVGRILRYICFFLAITVPAVFLSLSIFHFQLLPTNFALSVARLRAGVPMPSVIECIILILVFEILKETGVRMPQSLGHALSIVGGLVVGQAAVEAGIVSAPMLIAVALSGISGLMIPRLKGAVFYLRLIFVLLAAFFGLAGVAAGLSAVLLRIFNLSSFNEDYTGALKNPNPQRLKDSVIRAPWTFMKLRPFITKNLRRQKDKK